MSRSNLLPGILTLLVMVVWADHAWSRCGHRFGHGNRVRIVRRKVCIPAPLQEPDRGVTLAWKLKKGEPFYQEMTTDVTQKMTVMGQNITQKQKVTFYFTWAPVAKDEDGNWTVKQRIDALKMEVEIGG